MTPALLVRMHRVNSIISISPKIPKRRILYPKSLRTTAKSTGESSLSVDLSSLKFRVHDDLQERVVMSHAMSLNVTRTKAALATTAIAPVCAGRSSPMTERPHVAKKTQAAEADGSAHREDGGEPRSDVRALNDLQLDVA
jgi:hypothetical protein